eukprot:scaffold5787_cov179-Ochromonas_danica.AAC.2
MMTHLPLRKRSELYSVRLYQDNKSGIWLMTEMSKYRKTKHLLTKLAYLKDLVRDKVLIIQYLNTEDMPADALTKPLAEALFMKHMKMIGVR